MSVVSEANIHVELYRVLKNLISSGKGQFKALEFTDVQSELNVDGGRADLVVFGKENGLVNPFIVIETKRKNDVGVQRYFDPYSPKVIDQAAWYAMKMGADYFITTNGQVLVSFETFKTGVSLPDRRVKPYDLRMRITEEVVSGVLEDLAKIHIGVEKWLPLDEVFVNRMRTFHQFITQFVENSLKHKLYDLDFKKRYEEWLRSQFFEVSEETNKQIASQAAYVLMNRILFYKTLEAHRAELPRLHKIEYTSGGEFTVKLREYFKSVLDINYKAIFKEGILNEIPIPNPLADILNDFIEELDTYNLAKIQSDVIGRVYEDLIPEDERHRLGQYYTPPPIVDLIVEMTIKNPNDTVIDPGCGSGSFLVKAYNKLKELKLKKNPLRQPWELHEDILDQLWGIDINQFPAHLASINLAVRNLDVLSRNIQIVVSDFFKVNPDFVTDKDGKTVMIGLTEAITLDGKGLGKLPFSGFDVVITNPPYTRQEEMEYKDRIRDVALTYSDGSQINLSGRAGIYAYFFIHSAKLLKNGGMIGYITSNTWLDVGFGSKLKKFFLERFKINNIIEFERAVFQKADVNTCIVTLQKAEGKKLANERESNIVKFVRLKKRLDISNILININLTENDFEDENYRIITINQHKLDPKEKWGTYLRAPKIFFELLKKPKVIKLGDISEIKYGIKTGAEDFFYLDAETIKLWNIEKKFVYPIVTEPRKIKYYDLQLQDFDEIDTFVLLCNQPKDAIDNTNIIKYIEYGETKGYHKRKTTSSRTLWYGLGVREPKPILLSRMNYQRFFTLWNKGNVLADDSFYEITPNSEEWTPIILGSLNSTISALLLELYGRSYKAGVLEIKVYETKLFPVLDPRKLSEVERNKIEKAFLDLCASQRGKLDLSEKEAQRYLDKVVFNILELNDQEIKQIYEGLSSLRDIRYGRRNVGVLVETEEGWNPPQRRKSANTRDKTSSKRLEMWM